ncbi:uncharacterized protein LOC111868041 isoform X2 [Cryptotermes secundus]|uniref:uncharacterized protein LOC111868041 isoform X2 n=1 Tax=Cryptotermes secundus TaxID=105785 RepID=UPI001454CDCA|nr:uncharacterized protein LOC111868041 isoform X2 [Cryptotermes secundus]
MALRKCWMLTLFCILVARTQLCTKRPPVRNSATYGSQATQLHVLPTDFISEDGGRMSVKSITLRTRAVSYTCAARGLLHLPVFCAMLATPSWSAQARRCFGWIAVSFLICLSPSLLLNDLLPVPPCSPHTFKRQFPVSLSP